MSQYTERVVTFLFGIGDAQLGGPSILHGLTLIIAGMAFGRLIAGDGTARFPTTINNIAKRASILLVGSTLALTLGAFSSRETLLAELGNMSLRMDSDPLYFAAGLCGAVALTSFAVLVTDGLPHEGKKKLEKLVFFGRTSLFTFAFGNMFLYAWRGKPDTLGSAVLQVVTKSLVIIGLSYTFDREMRRRGRLATVVSSLQAKITSFVKMLTALIARRAEQS